MSRSVLFFQKIWRVKLAFVDLVSAFHCGWQFGNRWKYMFVLAGKAAQRIGLSSDLSNWIPGVYSQLCRALPSDSEQAPLSASLLPASLPCSSSCLVSWWTLGANAFKKFLSVQHLAQLTPISLGTHGCFSHASSSNKNNNNAVIQHRSTEANSHAKRRVWPTVLFHCVYEKQGKLKDKWKCFPFFSLFVFSGMFRHWTRWTCG